MESNASLNLRRTTLWLVIAVIAFLFLYEIRSILLPFVVGILTAYFLDPAADRLEAAGLKRGTSVVVITVAFFAVLITAALVVAPLLLHQFTELLAALPEYIADLQSRYGDVLERLLSQADPGQMEAVRGAISNAAAALVRLAGDVFTELLQSGMAMVNLLSLLLITPLVSFYLLRDWDAVTTRIDQLLPRAHALTIREQLVRVDETLAGFIRGQMNVCLILGLYYAILLSAVGLHFGLVIGLATGLLVILPYVGFLFGFITAMIVAFIQFGPELSLWLTIAVFAGGQVLESYFLTPKLVGDRVGLHPLWIIFGMLAGGALFGLVGVLIAVPVSAIIGVLIRFATERYLQSALYHGR